MSGLSVGFWHDVFTEESYRPGDLGRMARCLASITSIVADPCYTPMRKIELMERMFDDMALSALEAADGTR